jgi:mRNA deadenylase 3'-5' endonuclease subunit Ccr4
MNFEQKSSGKNISKKISDDLKIMSFNILADAPLWKKKYASMKKEKFIYWNYRKKLIIDIISKREPDICLLCEVEYSNILFFSKFCTKNNYGYIYTSMEPSKSTDSLEKYVNYTNMQNPGLFILFKLDKVKLINNLAPSYSNYFNNQSKKYNWSKEELQLYLQPCASNIILFEKLNDEKRFYFTGLHHPFIKENQNIQSKQISFLLQQINELNNNYNYPVIIAGDFNAEPTYDVYKIMNANKYNSAYKIFNGVENKYTASNSYVKKTFTLDYIFINNKCVVKNVHKVDDKYFKNNYIPNEEFPSDHMFLIANIIIK